LQTAKGLPAALLRGGARVATPVAIAVTVIDAGAGYVAGDGRRVARAAGAGAGAFTGAAALGFGFSWTGPGALVAAVIGGVGGGIGGGMAGEKWLDWSANYIMNVTGKDTAQRADSDIGDAFGPRIADYLAKIHEKLKPFDSASLARDMATAGQAEGEQAAAVYRVLQAELLRRQQMAVIEQAKGRRSGNASLTADRIAEMTKETIRRLEDEGKISDYEAFFALYRT
jgi:hypothetical protein